MKCLGVGAVRLALVVGRGIVLVLGNLDQEVELLRVLSPGIARVDFGDIESKSPVSAHQEILPGVHKEQGKTVALQREPQFELRFYVRKIIDQTRMYLLSICVLDRVFLPHEPAPDWH